MEKRKGIKDKGTRREHVLTFFRSYPLSILLYPVFQFPLFAIKTPAQLVRALSAATTQKGPSGSAHSARGPFRIHDK